MPDRVYTRKGDDGTTQLLFGGKTRVRKSDPRVAAYGDGDESVSALGIARAEAIASGAEDVADIVVDLQRQLFVLNAELATAPESWEKLLPGVSLVTAEMVDALEHLIDDLEKRFERPMDFIVPGDTRLGAALDHAARVVRRAERSVDRIEEVREEARRYVNRLADLVWVIARYAERGEQQLRPRDR
jgi:cob(I)alamin adenosyltransferase